MRALFLAAVMATTGGAALAQDVPNLVGTYEIAKFEGIAAGPSSHRADGDAGAIRESDTAAASFEITSQSGNRLTAKRVSDQSEETLLGMIAFDNEEIFFVDDDDFWVGRIMGNGVLEVCAMKSAKHDDGHALGVKCMELVKQ
ncbi:hypothetical protein [Bauldia sp.]|uniref:hypothetical protein n=1 Tax=Bauldia sp. TaxID=2575872 RepID=UPI003BA97664